MLRSLQQTGPVVLSEICRPHSEKRLVIKEQRECLDSGLASPCPRTGICRHVLHASKPHPGKVPAPCLRPPPSHLFSQTRFLCAGAGRRDMISVQVGWNGVSALVLVRIVMTSRLANIHDYHISRCSKNLYSYATTGISLNVSETILGCAWLAH